MSLEVARALRRAYDDIDGAETGQPSRAVIESIPSALHKHPSAATVALLWSAARALVLPQIALDAVEPCSHAIVATRRCVVAGATSSTPAEVVALLQHASPPGQGADPAQVQAQHCLAHALAFCLTSDPASFMRAMDAFVAAQHSQFARPARAKQAWIGWLDDVVSRSDRFTPDAILELLDRTVRGTLATLPPGFEWEGTADRDGQLGVWIMNPKTRKLVSVVMAVEPLEVKKRTLLVTVLAEPNLASDPLRIEYFVEHMIHRVFLGAMYADQYDVIDYRHLGTGETWQAPA